MSYSSPAGVRTSSGKATPADAVGSIVLSVPPCSIFSAVLSCDSAYDGMIVLEQLKTNVTWAQVGSQLVGDGINQHMKMMRLADISYDWGGGVLAVVPLVLRVRVTAQATAGQATISVYYL